MATVVWVLVVTSFEPPFEGWISKEMFSSSNTKVPLDMPPFGLIVTLSVGDWKTCAKLNGLIVLE